MLQVCLDIFSVTKLQNDPRTAYADIPLALSCHNYSVKEANSSVRLNEYASSPFLTFSHSDI